MAPSLPQRAGGRRVAGARPRPQSNTTEDLQGMNEIELEDGTKFPVKIPAGMPPAQAAALIQYLKTNPEQAKQIYGQAQDMLKSPGLAQAFLNMRVGDIHEANAANTPADMAEKYSALKDDPELKHVFDDVIENGPGAFQKYWDDDELMTKISAKMRSMSVSSGDAAAAPRPAAPAGPCANIHEAAKRGNIEEAQKFLDQGVAVDALNDRGISALGVAVGFNRLDMVDFLLSKGANPNLADPAGNNALHYAAGYGRKEVAEKLIAAGVDMHATNKAGLKPVGAAKMNKEMQLVSFLEEAMKSSKNKKAENA